MWFHRSSVWTHSMSLLGVSLARASHCAGVGSALAPAGASSPAATRQSETSHDFDSRKLRGFGFKTLLLLRELNGGRRSSARTASHLSPCEAKSKLRRSAQRRATTAIAARRRTHAYPM